MQIPDAPFHIVAFAPFLSDEATARSSPVRLIPVQSADQGLAELRPSLYVPLPESLSPSGGIMLEFSMLSDFEPAAIVARTPWMRALRDGRSAGEGVGKTAAAKTVLDSILDMVELPGKAVNVSDFSDEPMNEADAIISNALGRILSDDGFRRMEASWQGISLLFDMAGSGEFSLSIVPVVRETVTETLESLCALPGCADPDLILVDVPFDSSPVGMRMLDAASNLAESRMSPAICWFGPDFLQLGSWDDLETLPYLPNHLQGFSFARWKTARSRSSAFWTVAACNRFPLQPPSTGDPSAGMFRHDRTNYLAPVWGVASLLLQSYAEGSGLSALSSRTLDSQLPLEAAISADRASQMTESGLLPLMPAGSGSGIRLAKAVTINDASFLSALLLSTAIHMLVRLREAGEPCDDPEELAERVNRAFLSDHRFMKMFPGNPVSCEAAGINANDRIILEVTLKNRAFDEKNIEFTFEW